MSNPSLKDQLKALSIGLSSAPSNHAEPKKHIPKPGAPRTSTSGKPPAKKQKPAWLEQAQYGVELLKAHFPKCFKDLKDVQPLKVGIKQDLVKHLSTQETIVISDKACMVSSLAYYVNSVSYHKSMVVGATRVDLEGNAAGAVTAEEATYSSECRKAKQQKKQAGSTPKPQLQPSLETSK